MTYKGKKILKRYRVPLTLGVASIGTSIVGQPLTSKLPAGTKNPLTTTGRVTSSFVGPTTVLASAGLGLDELNKLRRKTKRGYR